MFWTLCEFDKLLEERVKETNSFVLKIPMEKTSYICPKCEFHSTKNRKVHIHMFSCQRCEFEENDDYAAAMNINNRGILVLKNTGKKLENHTAINISSFNKFEIVVTKYDF